jgi:hypothetical protein
MIFYKLLVISYLCNPSISCLKYFIKLATIKIKEGFYAH